MAKRNILVLMILAHHAIFTGYGFWLPNDERGSWSNEVWAKHLKRFGTATKTTLRRSLAKKKFDRALRNEARRALLYPAVRFNGLQARAVARGFAAVAHLLRLKVHACSILPDHVHLVVGRHAQHIEEIVGYLKRRATRQLTREERHPLKQYRRSNGATPTPWVLGGCNRFLNSDVEAHEAIDYVRNNPMGLKSQSWSFVRPYTALRSTL